MLAIFGYFFGGLLILSVLYALFHYGLRRGFLVVFWLFVVLAAYSFFGDSIEALIKKI